MIQTAQLQRIEAAAIGGSAGAVEAVSPLLRALASQCRVTFFVVLHLPRERSSRLVDIFAPQCALPVREPEDKEPAAPGTVYFAPPDYHLLVDRGPQLALSVDQPLHFSRPSIDVLFESAADVYGEHLMGVILTGANQDGAAGLRAIQQRGGITIVQEPSSAMSAVMPSAAIQKDPSSEVLSLAEIAEVFQMLNKRGLA